jgi:DtxR family Mn-dependent transcriptional regulator
MQREKEEFLETLWHMKEHGQRSMSELRTWMKQDFDQQEVVELAEAGLVDVGKGGSEVWLTPKGEEYARKLVRAHRIAERLVHDVLRSESESSACEFEHTVNPELVDGICTLLGHPRECPHGMPIPEGECCRRAATSAQASVVPLTQLDIGQAARIAYVECRSDRQLHRLEDMQIRPGNEVRLHQTYPAFVIECEGASIALDPDVASAIRVWRPPPPAGETRPRQRGLQGRFRFRHRRGRPG